MKNWNFGYFGKGLEGYAHYKAEYDRLFPQKAPPDSFSADDEDDYQVDEFQDEILEMQDTIEKQEQEIASHDWDDDSFGESYEEEDGKHTVLGVEKNVKIPISITFSVDTNNKQDAPIDTSSPPDPLPPNYDLTPHYFNGENSAYFEEGLRRAMSDYFPEYKESYEHVDIFKFNNDILREIFSVDKPLAFQMWRWQLEHFDAALRDPKIGFTLTMMDCVDSETAEWMYAVHKDDKWFWSRLFYDSTVIHSTHSEIMKIALENEDIEFFHFLMNYYMKSTAKRSMESFTLDMLLEEILCNCWIDDASSVIVEAIDGYIAQVSGTLRRAVLQKYREENIHAPQDEKDEADSDDPPPTPSSPQPASMTKELCRQMSLKLHQEVPLPNGVKFVDVVHVAGLFAGDRTAIKNLKENDTLALTREPDNSYDSNAIRIDDAIGRKIGYIPKAENGTLARLMDCGSTFICAVAVLPTAKDNNLWVEILQNLPKKGKTKINNELRLDLHGTTFCLQLSEKRDSGDDIVSWTDANITIKNRYFDYQTGEEFLTYVELQDIYAGLVELLNDQIEERQMLDFIEPDLRIILNPKYDLRDTQKYNYVREGHEIVDISADFIFFLSMGNWYTSQCYSLPLYRSDIEQLVAFLKEAMNAIDGV